MSQPSESLDSFASDADTEQTEFSAIDSPQKQLGVAVNGDFDERLRSAAFAYLRALQLRTGGPVRYDDVAKFEFEGQRITLLDRQRGIRKPAVLDAALSFRTVHAPKPELRPYDDAPGPDGYLRYKYRGTDATHAENRAMRVALTEQLPLIWFQGIDTGLYLPIFPVWLTGEEPEEHQFVVALDLEQMREWQAGVAEAEPELTRAYAERVVKERLHQPVFRARVLAAYETKCALCNLALPQLLEAAHIRSDSQGGEPVVTNGIAMCRIHHGAFDSWILGIDPNSVVHISDRVLAQSDGPTLQYAIQGVHGTTIASPVRRAARPDRDLLAERFEQFQLAS